MKSLLFVCVSALAIVAFGNEYPAQKVNRVDDVRFGQAQAEVEHILEIKAVTEESVLSRKGTDYSLVASGFTIDFDTGKLVGITFDSDFKFYAPIAMYPETWRNLEPIGTLRIKKGMMKSDFVAYFKAWEDRAIRLGARRNDGNELLKEGEYKVSSTVDEIMDMYFIGFGPERPTGKGGGSWGSGCSFSFEPAMLARMDGQKVGSLKSISLLCDEFNTHARHPAQANQSPQPSPAAGAAK